MKKLISKILDIVLKRKNNSIDFKIPNLNEFLKEFPLYLGKSITIYKYQEDNRKYKKISGILTGCNNKSGCYYINLILFEDILKSKADYYNYTLDKEVQINRQDRIEYISKNPENNKSFNNSLEDIKNYCCNYCIFSDCNANCILSKYKYKLKNGN